MTQSELEELIAMAGPIEFYADTLDTLAKQDPRLKVAAERLDEALKEIAKVIEGKKNDTATMA